MLLAFCGLKSSFVNKSHGQGVDGTKRFALYLTMCHVQSSPRNSNNLVANPHQQDSKKAFYISTMPKRPDLHNWKKLHHFKESAGRNKFATSEDDFTEFSSFPEAHDQVRHVHGLELLFPGCDSHKDLAIPKNRDMKKMKFSFFLSKTCIVDKF